jgi:hypothetical protein
VAAPFSSRDDPQLSSAEACGRSARWIVSEIAHGGIDVLGVADLPNDGDPPRLVRGE